MPTWTETLRAFLWPLAGAGLLLVASALLLAVGSFVPSWLRRILAATAAIAGLFAVRDARLAGNAQVTIPWQPLNLFRTGPTFQFDDLSAPVAIVVLGVSAAMLLGIRGRAPSRTSWHALALIALSGVVAMAAASNMLGLLLGSAVVDLSLIAALLFGGGAQGETRTLPLTTVMPGLASTLILFFAAVDLDAAAGHASLQAMIIPESIVMYLAVSGMLRMMVFPLHPRGISRPEDAALLLLPTGAGIYLMARAQHTIPVLPIDGWLAALAGGTLLVGGFLFWNGTFALSSTAIQADDGRRNSNLGEAWPAGLIHRGGYALLFAASVPTAPPWPLLGMMLPLAVLAICWDILIGEPATSRTRWRVWLQEQIGRRWQQQDARLAGRWRWIERMRGWHADRYVIPLVLLLAFSSLLGLPLTVGMRDRWPLYAALLDQQSPWLVVTLIADSWLAAGVWRVARSKPGWLRPAHPPATLSLLAAGALGLAIALVGVAPGIANLAPASTARVSGWGLALLLLLPWLLGAWLATRDGELARYAEMVRRFVSLDWLDAGASRVAKGLINVSYWFGQVAEGAGWWGWALIVLALAAVLLTVR